MQNKSKSAKNAVFTAFLKAGKDWCQFLGYIYKTLVACMQYPLYRVFLILSTFGFFFWPEAINQAFEKPG